MAAPRPPGGMIGVSRRLLKELAATEPGDAPYLSVYLDWRVDLSSPGRVETSVTDLAGREMGRRQSAVWFKDRLGELAQEYDTAEAGRRSFEADVERIQAYLNRPPDPAAKGLVFFACWARDVFAPLELPVPVPNGFYVDDRPHIYHLARLPEEWGRYALVMAESDLVKVFSITLGRVMDRETREEDPAEVRRHDQGGWSQARYQRHIDNTVMHFAKGAAELIQQVVDRDRLDEIILAADEPVRSELLRQMPEQLRARVFREEPILMDTPDAEAVEEVLPIIQERQREKAHRHVEELADRLGMGGAAAAGVEAVALALNEGRVGRLILDDAENGRRGWECAACGAMGGSDVEQCPYCGGAVRRVDLWEEMVRRAVRTDAELTVLHDGGALARWEGVGALLRF
ncbi:MAG TPA: Vms1/Ankzf1 family peptidyl-tRNA hydrolase [Dehalococcoidia bacterium]